MLLPVISSGTRQTVNGIAIEPNTLVQLATFGQVAINVRYYADRKRYELSTNGVLVFYSTELRKAHAAFKQEVKFAQWLAYEYGGNTVPF